MKTILIISAGIEAIFGIQKAKELGYFVVAADGNPNAPGFKYSDDKIICSTYDISGSIQRVVWVFLGVLEGLGSSRRLVRIISTYPTPW